MKHLGKWFYRATKKRPLSIEFLTNVHFLFSQLTLIQSGHRLDSLQYCRPSSRVQANSTFCNLPVWVQEILYFDPPKGDSIYCCLLSHPLPCLGMCVYRWRAIVCNKGWFLIWALSRRMVRYRTDNAIAGALRTGCAKATQWRICTTRGLIQTPLRGKIARPESGKTMC